MKRLEEIAQTFSVSRPIFNLTIDEDRRRISLNTDNPVYKYEPEVDQNDILAVLVAEHYSEKFDPGSGEFCIDPDRIASDTMEHIRRMMPTFLEKNLEMKNPRQSKIYKWFYRGLPNTYDFNDAIVLLYKYMRSFSDENMRASNTEHLNNAIAVMEAIMEKYNDEK